jgi:hypothetical protein
MSQLPNKPILIFSEYCQHSTNFLKILMKHPEIYDSVIRLCIDVEVNTRTRPKTFYQLQQILQVKITHVPTIITIGGEHILSDKEAFKWLESVIKANSNTEVGGFNPLEMTSFSDGYASFGSTDLNDCAKEQSFKFFKDGLGEEYDPHMENGKPTFQEEISSKTNNNEYAIKQQERDSMDQSFTRNGNMGRMEAPQKVNNKIGQSEYSNRLQNRNNINRQVSPGQRPPIDFTNINFGLESKLSNVDPRFKQTEKQKVLDQRLEQLMADRAEL